MRHSGTVPPKASERSNLGGRPERPSILALEGHIEDLVLLKDDAQVFFRSSSTIAHLTSHADEAAQAGDLDRMRRALNALRKLANHLRERYAHLVNVGIPEVIACYRALEAVVG